MSGSFAVPFEGPFEEIGLLVVIIRRLEGTVYSVARALGAIDPERMTTKDAAREAGRLAREGLPPWSRDVAVERVERWSAEVREVFRQQDAVVHWNHALGLIDAELVGVRTDPRRPESTGPHNSAEAVSALKSRAVDAASEGSRILRRLLVEVSPWVYVWHPSFRRVPGKLTFVVVFDRDERGDFQPHPDLIDPETVADDWRHVTKSIKGEWAEWAEKRLRDSTASH